MRPVSTGSTTTPASTTQSVPTESVTTAPPAPQPVPTGPTTTGPVATGTVATTCRDNLSRHILSRQALRDTAAERSRCSAGPEQPRGAAASASDAGDAWGREVPARIATRLASPACGTGSLARNRLGNGAARHGGLAPAPKAGAASPAAAPPRGERSSRVGPSPPGEPPRRCRFLRMRRPRRRFRPASPSVEEPPRPPRAVAALPHLVPRRPGLRRSLLRSHRCPLPACLWSSRLAIDLMASRLEQRADLLGCPIPWAAWLRAARRLTLPR